MKYSVFMGIFLCFVSALVFETPRKSRDTCGIPAFLLLGKDLAAALSFRLWTAPQEIDTPAMTRTAWETIR
jgi:hypothetical protein